MILKIERIIERIIVSRLAKKSGLTFHEALAVHLNLVK